MPPEVFDLSANHSFVQSSASAQLSLIPLCTLFPLNISRFHAYTCRHNRSVIVYPFAAWDQGWDSNHRGTLASSAPGAVWEHSGKLDEKLDPKSHCLIWLTSPSAADRECCLRVCQTAVDKHMYRLFKHCKEDELGVGDCCMCVCQKPIRALMERLRISICLSVKCFGSTQVPKINSQDEREDVVKENMKLVGVKG